MSYENQQETSDKSGIIECISIGKKIIIGACDSSEDLVDATDIFHYIESGMQRSNNGMVTAETEVAIYEVLKSAGNAQPMRVLTSLDEDVRKFILTSHQIKKFVIHHQEWMVRRYAGTHFLFEFNKHLFFAIIYFTVEGRLGVIFNPLLSLTMNTVSDPARFVVPKLA